MITKRRVAVTAGLTGVTVAGLLSLPSPAEAAVPRPFSINDSKTLASQKGIHFGFPTIAEAPNGDIVVVARRGDSHLSSDGQLFLWRSRNNGASWSKPTKLLGYPGNQTVGDAAFFRAKNGTLYLTFGYRNGAHAEGIYQTRFMWSHDSGKTWSRVKTISNLMASAPMYQRKDGTFVQVLYNGGSAYKYVLTKYGWKREQKLTRPGVYITEPWLYGQNGREVMLARSYKLHYTTRHIPGRWSTSFQSFSRISARTGSSGKALAIYRNRTNQSQTIARVSTGGFANGTYSRAFPLHTGPNGHWRSTYGDSVEYSPGKWIAVMGTESRYPWEEGYLTVVRMTER